MPSTGAICDDVLETVFGNQTTPTKRGLWHDELEEQILGAGQALSQAKLTRLFGVHV